VEVREDVRGLLFEFLYSLSNVGIGFGEVLGLHINRGSPLSILLVFFGSRRKGQCKCILFPTNSRISTCRISFPALSREDIFRQVII
jgi:hypothetical protein